MMMLVNCSNCHTPLQLPSGARSIRCAICQAITTISEPRSAPSPNIGGYGSATSGSHWPPARSPSPYAGHIRGPPPSPHGKKKALIVGISYRSSRNELKGCINDAKCMKYLLLNRFQFPDSSILMLTGKNNNHSFFS